MNRLFSLDDQPVPRDPKTDTTAPILEIPRGVYLPDHVKQLQGGEVFTTQQPLHYQGEDKTFWCKVQNDKWIYSEPTQPYDGQEVPYSTYNQQGGRKTIPYHLPKPANSYYSEDEKRWKCRTFPNGTRAETKEQEQNISVQHNQWIYTDHNGELVKVLTADPDYENLNFSPESEPPPPPPTEPLPVRDISPEGTKEDKQEGQSGPSGDGPPSDPSSDNTDTDSASDSDEEDMAKDAKISPPEAFNGEAAKVQEFITDCELYFAANEEKFDKDVKKVAFALSYMKGGTAGAWKSMFLEEANGPEDDSEDEGDEEAESILPVIPKVTDYGTWKDFKRRIRKEFEHAAQQIQSRFDLDSIRQGTTNATDYVTRFKILASKGKITGDNAKITFFQKGLNPGLRSKIYSTFPLPKNFDEWCERATAMDAQWRASNITTPGTCARPSNWKNRSNTTQIRAVNLSFQERKKYIEEGRCFRCDQVGHRAADPKFHPKNNQSARSNPFQKGLGQQVRQTTVDNQSTSTPAPQQDGPWPKGKSAIHELVRKIQNMTDEDQETALAMFGEMEDAATNSDNGQDFYEA